MSSPDRPGRGLHSGLALATLLLVIATVAGCSERLRGSGEAAPPALRGMESVELVGTARGPLGGLGGEVGLHVFLRADGALRADLRRTPDDGPPVHEVLLWTEDTALTFDRRTGRFTDLGDEPGMVEAWGGVFRAPDVLWLLGGVRPDVERTPMDWQRHGDEWRGRRGDLGLRRSGRERVFWTEAVWRDTVQTVHRLRAEVEEWDDGGPVGSWPRRLGLDGSDLEARAVVEWDLVRWHPALGDSILDPLWEPFRP